MEQRFIIQKKIKVKRTGYQRPRVRTLDERCVALGDGGTMVFKSERYFK